MTVVMRININWVSDAYQVTKLIRNVICEFIKACDAWFVFWNNYVKPVFNLVKISNFKIRMFENSCDQSEYDEWGTAEYDPRE